MDYRESYQSIQNQQCPQACQNTNPPNALNTYVGSGMPIQSNVFIENKSSVTTPELYQTKQNINRWGWWVNASCYFLLFISLINSLVVFLNIILPWENNPLDFFTIFIRLFPDFCVSFVACVGISASKNKTTQTSKIYVKAIVLCALVYIASVYFSWENYTSGKNVGMHLIAKNKQDLHPQHWDHKKIDAHEFITIIEDDNPDDFKDDTFVTEMPTDLTPSHSIDSADNSLNPVNPDFSKTPENQWSDNYHDFDDTDEAGFGSNSQVNQKSTFKAKKEKKPRPKYTLKPKESKQMAMVLSIIISSSFSLMFIFFAYKLNYNIQKYHKILKQNVFPYEHITAAYQGIPLYHKTDYAIQMPVGFQV